MFVKKLIVLYEQEIVLTIFITLLGVIMVSGCSSKPTDILLQQSVVTYVDEKEGITDTSQTVTSMDTRKISENEVYVTTSVNGHLWEGIWSYDENNGPQNLIS